MKPSELILKRHEFIIIRTNKDYVIYNTKKIFNQGHTHASSFNVAISLIKLVERKQIPKNKSKWFLDSILRINKDAEYAERIKDLMLDYRELMEEDSEIDSRRCE